MASSGSQADVLRSLRRYVWLILGEPWTVRLGRVRVADDNRPAAVIDPSGVATTLFSRAGTRNQGDTRQARTFTVVAYPALGEIAPESVLAAEGVAQQLEAGFQHGLITDDTPAKMIGAPWRVPIWDYSATPITGATRAGPADPYSYLNVTDTGFNVRVLQDAVDELRYSVIATVPVTWWRGGRIAPAGPVAVDAPGTFIPAG